MFPKSQLWLLLALAVAGCVAASGGRIDTYVLDVVMGVGINIILAASLNLINGFTGQFSLGHAGFMAVGAYAAASLTTVFRQPFGTAMVHQPWLMLPVALLAGGLMAAAAGLLVGAPSLRLKGDYLAIVTLGFGEIIKVVLQNIDMVGAALGLNGIPTPLNRGWATPILFFNLGSAAVTVYVVWALVNSTFGRGFLAVADDEVAAEAMGLNATRYKIIAFVVGSFFAGI
ncbi:MAG TPA: branched-chain amino acid ABC transporter permease, partial [Verrucomicrobiales bacterium]|nr:branched-chain amino acid ABC transporter permease [Verrucomicrobiales bacterium]